MRLFEENFCVETQDIKAFARVACDPNPIHQNLEAAKQMGLEGPIAHGMFLYCYLMRRLDEWLALETNEGRSWAILNTKCRFHDPALVGGSFDSFLEKGDVVEGKMKLNLVLMHESKKLCMVTAHLELS